MHGKIGSYILLKQTKSNKFVGLLHYNSLTAKKFNFAVKLFLCFFYYSNISIEKFKNFLVCSQICSQSINLKRFWGKLKNQNKNWKNVFKKFFQIYFWLQKLLKFAVRKFLPKKHTLETLGFKGVLAPQTGLEPVTLRLTAACSTDWAIRAHIEIWTKFNLICPPKDSHFQCSIPV